MYVIITSYYMQECIGLRLKDGTLSIYVVCIICECAKQIVSLLCQKYLISWKPDEAGEKLISYVTYKYLVTSYLVYQSLTRPITVIISLVIP